MGTHAITDDHKKFIKGVVHLIRPQARLYMFGSRANDTAKPASDLDIILKEDQEIPLSNIIDIRELLKASRLPFSVDIIDWHNLSKEFASVIADDLKEF